jgi:hypothetical protein
MIRIIIFYQSQFGDVVLIEFYFWVNAGVSPYTTLLRRDVETQTQY